MAQAQTTTSTVENATAICHDSFHKLLNEISDQALLNQVEDCASRFQIWAGNIGARQPAVSKSSADSRLVDAPEVKERILRLLADLAEILDELDQALDGKRLEEADGEGTSAEPGDEGLVNEVQEISERQELCLMVGDLITNLMKVTVLVRKATGRDRYVRAAASVEDYFPPDYDIRHVADCFPKAQIWLQERLGRAIAQRRQYLKYTQKHGERLAKNQTAGNKPSTAVPGAADFPHIPLRPTTAYAMSVNNKTEASTKASTLQPDKIDESALQTLIHGFDDTTSQATSRISAGDEDNEKLRIADLNDLSPRREYFECPHCKQLVKFGRQSAWRKHVLEDLRSYVCTFQDCPAGLFRTRDAWFDHELEAHRRVWTCQTCAAPPCLSAASFRMHLEKTHQIDIAIMDDPTGVVDAHSRPISDIPASSCPLCNDWEQRLEDDARRKGLPEENVLVVSPSDFSRHLGRHQERLALFAIPPALDELKESASNSGGDSGVDEDKKDEDLLHWQSEADLQDDLSRGFDLDPISDSEPEDWTYGNEPVEAQDPRQGPGDRGRAMSPPGSDSGDESASDLEHRRERQTRFDSYADVIGHSRTYEDEDEDVPESGSATTADRTDESTGPPSPSDSVSPPDSEASIVYETAGEAYRTHEPRALSDAPTRGILKKPTVKFPDFPGEQRPGVARLKDATETGIPAGARWTKIDRRLVNPEALEEAQERFEERLDCVIVLRVLTHEEIQKLADRTREIRDEEERELREGQQILANETVDEEVLREEASGTEPFAQNRNENTTRKDNERNQQEAFYAFRSVIKHLDPPVRVSDVYEDVAPRLHEYDEYHAITDEAVRKDAFERHIRRLRERSAAGPDETVSGSGLTTAVSSPRPAYAEMADDESEEVIPGTRIDAIERRKHRPDAAFDRYRRSFR